MYDLICKINCIKLFELLPQYIMAAGVLFAYVAFRSNNKSNHLSVIEKCSDEYRDLARKVQALQNKTPKDKAEDGLIRDFLGLFHKQLFYIQNHYVPKDIKIEWINSMHSIMINEKYADVDLIFKYENYKSFERIIEFMGPEIIEVENDPNKQEMLQKKEDLKNYRKFYKKQYFRFFERLFLNKNKQWNKAF